MMDDDDALGISPRKRRLPAFVTPVSRAHATWRFARAAGGLYEIPGLAALPRPDVSIDFEGMRCL